LATAAAAAAEEEAATALVVRRQSVLARVVRAAKEVGKVGTK
jgi:hypothetical protein